MMYFFGIKTNVSDFFSCEIENVDILVNLKAYIEQRNGQDYIVANGLSVVSNDILNFKVEFDHQYMPATMANLADRVFYSNWKMMKSLMDPTINRFAGDTIKSALMPMFNEISIQDFVKM